MKKRILFIIHRLNCGGVEKALINLLNTIDRENYESELLVIENKGDFKKFMPEGLKIYEYNAPVYVKTMLEKLTNVKFEKNEKLTVKIRKVYWKLVYFVYRVTRKFLKKNIIYKVVFNMYKKNNIYDNYDAIIDFHGYGAYTTYLAAYLGNNVKRISWIHEQNIYMTYHLIANCYKEFDQIFGCSRECCDNYIGALGEKNSNVSIYYNYLDIDEIKRKAEEGIDKEIWGKKDIFKIISIGRVSEQKAFSRVVECAQILRDKGYSFKWIVVGDGNQLTSLRTDVSRLHLNDCVNFIGYYNNPYPFMKQADLYVQTSIAEGFCTTISEAIILGKPIITTDVGGANEQLEGNKGGIITEQSVEGIVRAIIEVINDERKLANMAEYNANKDMDFRGEINKLYKCLGD